MPFPASIGGAISAQQPGVRSLKAGERESETHYGGTIGRVLRRRVANVLKTEQLYPLLSVARNEMQPFQYLFEYYGLRYHLLLERNECIEDALENKHLRMVSCAVEDEDYKKEDLAIANCLDLFWPHIVNDSNQRGPRTTDKPYIKDRLVPKPFINLQMKTLGDRVLHKISHDTFINYPLSDPIDNPCPDVHLFERDEIELLDEIHTNVFKVKIKGETYRLKVAPRKELRREITIFASLPIHPSLPHLVGLVSARQGKVDQFVSSFIVGRSLRRTMESTEDRKRAWKEQISDAVRVLHENDIVWGDVNPGNVIIESETGRAVLIDFAGGVCRGWVDSELRESKCGDLQGLSRLFTYIDNINTDNIDSWRTKSEAGIEG